MGREDLLVPVHLTAPVETRLVCCGREPFCVRQDEALGGSGVRRSWIMSVEPDVAAVAALIGEPTRAAMLGALLSGVALPAGELATRARIAPQTASKHLARLVEG